MSVVCYAWPRNSFAGLYNLDAGEIHLFVRVVSSVRSWSVPPGCVKCDVNVALLSGQKGLSKGYLVLKFIMFLGRRRSITLVALLRRASGA